MNWFIVILTLLPLWTVDVSGNITVCIPFHKNENDKKVDYQTVAKDLKQKSTAFLEENNSTQFIEHLDIKFDHPAVSIKGELNNVYVSNLNDFSLKYFHNIDIFHNKMELFNLTFHNLSLVGDYNLYGNIGELFDIYGDSDFWLNLLNFSISTTSNFPSINSTDACITFVISLNTQSSQGWLNKLMNDDELEEAVNHTIIKLIPEAIDIIWSEVRDDLDGRIQKWIESIINGNSTLIQSAIQYAQENSRLTNDE